MHLVLMIVVFFLKDLVKKRLRALAFNDRLLSFFELGSKSCEAWIVSFFNIQSTIRFFTFAKHNQEVMLAYSRGGSGNANVMSLPAKNLLITLKYKSNFIFG